MASITALNGALPIKPSNFISFSSYVWKTRTGSSSQSVVCSFRASKHSSLNFKNDVHNHAMLGHTYTVEEVKMWWQDWVWSLRADKELQQKSNQKWEEMEGEVFKHRKYSVKTQTYNTWTGPVLMNDPVVLYIWYLNRFNSDPVNNYGTKI